MAKVLTVNDLYSLCATRIKEGRGGRKILLSGDDEGNSYHEMFFGFTSDMDFSESYMACCLPSGVKAEDVEKEYIVLG